MPKKISKIGYRKKTETDPLVRASAALKRLTKATEKIDEKDLPEIKEKFSNILQMAIDDLSKGIEPTVKCLKLCVQLKDEKSVLEVFNLSRTPDKEKIKRFIQKVEGFTRGERLYLHGVLRRNTAYFDGTLEAEMQALYENGEHRKGLALVRKWLGKIEGDDHLFAREGLFLSRLGCHREAIASFGRSIAIDANVFAWWVFRGDTCADLGEYDAAIRDYSISFSLDEDNWAAYDKCARALFLSGQTDKAIEYEEYAVKKGGSAEATLVLISMLKGAGKRGQAQVVAKRGLKQFPKDHRFQEFIDEL